MSDRLDPEDIAARITAELGLTLSPEELDCLREGHARMRALLAQAAAPRGLETPLALRFRPGDEG